MLKYSPDSLQFYLLDFKMGGMELNRYRSYPHVRALLVDESDPGITLEILNAMLCLKMVDTKSKKRLTKSLNRLQRKGVIKVCI